MKEYLKYRKEVGLLSDNSLCLEKTWLHHLLMWAQDHPYEKAPKIRPSLPEHMLQARLDGSGKTLSPIYVKKVIRASYNFFQWLRTHESGFRLIDQAWLDTLKPPRMTIEYKEHEAVTIEEITAIANAPVFTMRDRRIRAAAVFWFLSGIRIGAFVSLPIKAVDIEDLTIRQWPKLGVKTKLIKHATTFLLDISELLEIIKEWDDFVRNHLSIDSCWFAPLSPETGELDFEKIEVGKNRDQRARKDLEDWLERVGLPYHSPHKFRHGFAVYAIKHAKDMSDMKAISQNLMHANISITDGIYGGLSDMDIKKQITSLTSNSIPDDQQSLLEILRISQEIMNKLENIKS
ncbi:MAG: tyrosine-type recombinase/integrase [Candidatus Helarchaeota archaeon]